MLQNYHAIGPVDEADFNRATGTLNAFLGHPDRAHHGYTRARECYEAIHDTEQAGTDAAWEYLFVQIPYFADQPENRQRLAHLVARLWTDDSVWSLNQGAPILPIQ